jgi:hypothetical protein
MSKASRSEVIFWSIALPGFGQFINRKYIKGIVLITLEFIINIKSHLNIVIVSSFHGDIIQAINDTNYQWLMFYPCVYLYGIWDAYRDAGGGQDPFSYLPFVFSAYLGTIGVIYSSNLKIMNILLGPIWLSISFLFLGYGIGLILKFLVLRCVRSQ